MVGNLRKIERTFRTKWRWLNLRNPKSGTLQERWRCGLNFRRCEGSAIDQMIMNRSAVRHRQFTQCVEVVSRRIPLAERIIDGAIWEIQRDPRGCGIYIEEIDVWQAHLILPSPPHLYLFYCINRRYVTMLTIKHDNGSPLAA